MSILKQQHAILLSRLHVGPNMMTASGALLPSRCFPQSKKKQNEIRAKQKEEASKQVFAPRLL